MGMAAWYWARRAKRRGVGPAGRMFRWLSVRGRRRRSVKGARRRVGGRVDRRND